MSLPQLNEICVGFGPIDLTVDCYVDEPEFLRKSEAYRVKKFAMRVNLLANRPGLFKGIDVRLLETLPSFFFLKCIATPNSMISSTTNYFSVPGFLALVHEDRGLLEKDYQTIREWERKGRVIIYDEKASHG